MKTFIYGVALAAFYCSPGLSTPTAPTDADHLGARIVRPCPEICPQPGTFAQPTGPDGSCACPSTTVLPSFPIRPLSTPRSIHCDFVCLPGTEHDPSGPICNCDKTVPTLPEKRSPQGPICDIVCPPGYENDPADGDCNCAKPICDPSTRCFAIGELYQYNPITHSCHCEYYQLDCPVACPTGFERDLAISGCNCLLKIPTTSTSGTAVPTLPPRNIEERNPEATPVCRFACPPCRAHDPAIPGCNCALNTCPASTTLTKKTTLVKRICDIVCFPPEVFDAYGCGCHLPVGDKQEEAALEVRNCDIVCIPPEVNNVGSCGCHSELPAKREPSGPVCDFECPPCYAHDPAIPGCNCALETCGAGP